MDIAIVGAGIGGLTTALLLNKQGHKVTIYEKSEEVGGRIKFQRHGPYKIDQGPTIVLLPQMIQNVLRVAEVDPEILDLVPCEPLYDLIYPDGATFTKWRDVSKQLSEIERVFPGEGPQYLSYMTQLAKTFQAGEAAFLSQLFLNKKDFLTTRNIKLLVQSRAYKTTNQYVRRYYKHQRLQEAYSLQTLYIGGVPSQTPALYSLISYSEHAHGIWYLRGGYARFIEKLEKECLDRGVRIQKATEVDEILVQHQSAKGVRLGSEKVVHDAVVYNGDFPHLKKLLPQNAQPNTKTSFTPSTGCLLIYAGVKKRWPQALMHQFFMPDEFDKHMASVSKGMELPDDPAFYVFNPVALDAQAAPPNESVLYFLVPVSSQTSSLDKESFKPLVEKVLREAERRRFDGLREQLTWLDFRTPQDALSDGLYQGGSFGVAPLLSQSGGFRPQVAPYKIKGLYSVGASVHPGGGVPIVMQGALLLSQYLAKEFSVC